MPFQNHGQLLDMARRAREQHPLPTAPRMTRNNYEVMNQSQLRAEVTRLFGWKAGSTSRLQNLLEIADARPGYDPSIPAAILSPYHPLH